MVFKVNDENRNAIIYKLSKGNADALNKFEKLTNEELANLLSNNKVYDSSHVNNPFGNDLINVSKNPNSAQNSLIFDFSANIQQNIFDYGLVVEKSNCSTNVSPKSESSSTSEAKAQPSPPDTPEGIASALYKDMKGIGTSKTFNQNLKQINKDNVMEVLENFNKISPDESLIKMIAREWEFGGLSLQERVASITYIMDALVAKAKELGVSEDDIFKAQNEFSHELKIQEKSFAKKMDTTNLEKAMKFLQGAIIAKQMDVEPMDSKSAREVATGEVVEQNESAQKQYSEARKAEEGRWAPKTADTVLSWFGCISAKDMEEKLGVWAKDVKRLQEAVNDEKKFKLIFYEIFGVEFSEEKITAWQKASENYQDATLLNLQIDSLKKIDRESDYATLRETLKTTFGHSDEILDTIIENYSASSGITNPTDEDKKKALVTCLNELQKTSEDYYQKLSGGKSLEKMASDLDIIKVGAFGMKSSIVEDVIDYNQKQLIRETVTIVGAEVAGTILLNILTGGLAAPLTVKTAASLGKVGYKAARIVKMSKTMGEGITLMKHTQRAQKVVQGIKTAMLASVATFGVDLWNNPEDAKGALKNAFRNGLFAGVGATASEIAPVLAKALNIKPKIMTEIIEDIIDTMGSAAVTKMFGENYTGEDAALDMFMNILFARLSQIGRVKAIDIDNTKTASDASTTKPADNTNTTTASDASTTKPADNTNTTTASDASTTKPADNTNVAAPKAGGEIGNSLSRINLKGTKFEKYANLSSEEFRAALLREYPNPKDILDDMQLMRELGRENGFNPGIAKSIKNELNENNIGIFLEILQKKELSQNVVAQVFATINSLPDFKDYSKLLNTEFPDQANLLTACTVLRDYSKNPNEDIQDIISLAFNPNLANNANKIGEILDLINRNPEYKNDIISLAFNPNLANNANEIGEILDLINRNPEYKNDIIRLSNLKHFGYQAISKNLEDFKKYPEFRDIMLNDNVSSNFIEMDPSKNNTAEILSQRKSAYEKIEELAKSSKLRKLKKLLGNYFNDIKWETLVPENATKSDIDELISKLTNRSSTFIRIASIETSYGKNGVWATEMFQIIEKAEVRIRNGENFRSVLDNIAEDYRNYTLADPTSGNKNRRSAGSLRDGAVINYPYYTPYLMPGDIPTKSGYYTEYHNRFEKTWNLYHGKKESPYPDMEVTQIDGVSNTMEHPRAENPSGIKTLECGLKHVDQCYQNLNPLIAKVQKGETLSPEELKKAKANIAEISFLMTNIMPYQRGSAGINDALVRGLYKSLNLEMPIIKKGVALDLEAFCLNLDEYIKNWDSFFE